MKNAFYPAHRMSNFRLIGHFAGYDMPVALINKGTAGISTF